MNTKLVEPGAPNNYNCDLLEDKLMKGLLYKRSYRAICSFDFELNFTSFFAFLAIQNRLSRTDADPGNNRYLDSYVEVNSI